MKNKLSLNDWAIVISLMIIVGGLILVGLGGGDKLASDDPVKITDIDESISTSNIGLGGVYNIAGDDEIAEFKLDDSYDSVVFEANIYYVNSTGLERGGFGGGSSSAIEGFENVELSINSSESIAKYDLKSNYAFAVVDSGVEIKGSETAEGYSREGNRDRPISHKIGYYMSMFGLIPLMISLVLRDPN